MLDEGDGAPSIDAAVVLCDEVPIAIDPAVDVRLGSGRKRRSTVEAVLPTWNSQVKSLKGRIGELRSLDDDTLMEILEEAGRLHGDMTSTRLLGMFEWIDGERSCADELARLVGVDDVPEAVLDDLCAGVEHETARMNAALEELMRKSASTKDRSAWKDDFDRFMERFGHMEINGTVAHSARHDLIAYVEAGPRTREGAGRDLNTVSLGRERARKQRQRLMDMVEGDQRVAVEGCIRRLRELRVVREDSKSLANLPLPMLRDAIRECTGRLQARGVLPMEASVDLLTPQELRDVLVLGKESANVKERKRAIRWKQERSWLPAGFLGEVCDPSQESFTGLPASPGTARGPARVVRGVSDFPNVAQGDVLVAPSTNPAWTILFGRVAAVVVENGSRLSHAAIVAREYGIPAVVALPGICEAIRDGEDILVDGDVGSVERLDGQGPHQ